MRGTFRLPRRSWCILAIASVLAGPQVPLHATAQTKDGHNEDRTRDFTLDALEAYLDIEGDFRYSSIESKRTVAPQREVRQRNREWGFEESFGLRLGGSIIDPRFISYRADLSFGLTQDRFEEFGGVLSRTDSDTGTLLRYDMRLNLFQGEKLSGSVYGFRRDDRINRRFQPTLDDLRTRFGTSWTWADKTLPMELSYDFEDSKRRGNRDRSDDEDFTESNLRYGLRWLIDTHHTFKLSYDHTEREQEYQGRRRRFETSRDLFTFEDELAFGGSHRNVLRTLIHWQEETGDFARDLFEIGPQLTLHHSDSLQTLYKYQFNRDRYQALDVETHRADFQLVHQVYSNLTTTFGAFGLYEEIEGDVRTAQYGTSVDWQYNRRNRFGHLYANLALAYDTEDVEGGGGRRLVLDESHVFRDPVDVTLRNRNVVVTAVVLTDPSNRVVFRPAIDYYIYNQGNVTRIARTRTGRIADGDTVLIDYQFNTPADGQLDTVRVDFSLEQRFTNGWTPYYRFSYRNQEDDTSFGFASRADRTDHHRLGANYKSKRYAAGAEYEIFDDTVDPYDAFHINGAVYLLQRADHSLDASTRLSRLFFEGGVDDRNVTLIDVSLDHRWRINDSVSTVERLGYRYEDDSIEGITHGWDASVGVEYVWGQFTSELTMDYDRLDLPGSEEEEFGVYFRIRRDFGDLLARR